MSFPATVDTKVLTLLYPTICTVRLQRKLSQTDLGAALGILEKLAALVPWPRVHLTRYGGCLASHSTLREAVVPTPRHQGHEAAHVSLTSPRWQWATRLQRVCALDMARCPRCLTGSLRLIAALTQGEGILYSQKTRTCRFTSA